MFRSPRSSVRAFAIPARDPRLQTRRPRSRAQVQSEVAGLERAVDAMKEGDQRRPAMLRRLADALSEMASSASGPQAMQLRGDAILRYRALVDGYPQYPQLDEARYYLAFGYEQNGDLNNARRSYYEVVAHHPGSKLVPLAYFAFGEMFFVEALADPAKNELARQAFAEVLRYPPADNAVYADALLRQGETELRLRDDAKARRSFDLLRRDFPGSEAARKIPLP